MEGPPARSGRQAIDRYGLAYVRPSGDRIGELNVAATGSADAMIPIATATVTSSGSFTLRASFDDTLAWVKSADDSFTVMIVGSKNGAIGVEMNTMWWAPPVGRKAGSWLLSNPALPNDEGAVVSSPRALASPNVTQTADDAPDSPMRPYDLKMQPTPATTGAESPRGVQAATVRPPGSCVLWGGSTYPDSRAYVGLTMFQASGTWEGDFRVYTDEYIELSDGMDRVRWFARPRLPDRRFRNTSSTSDFGGDTHVTSNKNAPVVARHWITVHMNRAIWKCWNSNTPPPANPGYWPEVHTLEPGRWVRDSRTPPARCLGATQASRQRQFRVAPHTGITGTTATPRTSRTRSRARSRSREQPGRSPWARRDGELLVGKSHCPVMEEQLVELEDVVRHRGSGHRTDASGCDRLMERPAIAAIALVAGVVLGSCSRNHDSRYRRRIPTEEQ